MFLTSSYSKSWVGERNKSEVGAGRKRRWIGTDLRVERKKESPSHWERPDTGVCR